MNVANVLNNTSLAQTNPLPPPKLVIKTHDVLPDIQKIGLEIGFDNYTVGELGDRWKQLCQLWVTAEAALMGAPGMSPMSSFAKEFRPPKSLVEWSNLRKQKSSETVSFRDLTMGMRNWSQRCFIGCKDVNDAVEREWCRPGLGGIILFLLGLREWARQIKTNEEWMQWSEVLDLVKFLFEEIPNAAKVR